MELLESDGQDIKLNPVTAPKKPEFHCNYL